MKQYTIYEERQGWYNPGEPVFTFNGHQIFGDLKKLEKIKGDKEYRKIVPVLYYVEGSTELQDERPKGQFVCIAANLENETWVCRLKRVTDEEIRNAEIKAKKLMNAGISFTSSDLF